jgi:hypothetical protein
MPDVRLEQINYKGRTLKVGHPVRVLPSKKGGRDGYDSLVKAFYGRVEEDPATGARKGKVTGIEVTDPKTGNTRTLGPERIVPYLRNVEAKATTLAERKKVVPIGRAKKAVAAAAAEPKVPTTMKRTTRATQATKVAAEAAKAAREAATHQAARDTK